MKVCVSESESESDLSLSLSLSLSLHVQCMYYVLFLISPKIAISEEWMESWMSKLYFYMYTSTPMI